MEETLGILAEKCTRYEECLGDIKELAEMIINGVDVSECEFLIKRENFIYCMGQLQTKKGISSRSYECLENPNCYYKQLKRKEQECKELKSKLQKVENNCIKICNLFFELGEKYTKSKAECENLKKELSAYGATGICEACSDKSVLKADELLAQNIKYKKFVETIKSRIKGYKESCDEFCQYDRKCCHSCFTGGAIELGEDIEMDINEVENER